MGADFIGMMVVGPRELDKSVEVSNKAAQRLKEFITGFLAIEELNKKVANKELTNEETYQEQLDKVYDETPELLSLEEMSEGGWCLEYKDKEMMFVLELLDVWETGSRDSICRWLDDDKKVVAAGDMSWGDEPDGFGYRTLKHAEQAGLFPIFKLG
jgi:hypothetical protein